MENFRPPASPAVSSPDAHIQRGLRWSFARLVIINLISTVGVVVYTRLIQPEDLGAFGITMVVFNGLFLLTAKKRAWTGS